MSGQIKISQHSLQSQHSIIRIRGWLLLGLRCQGAAYKMGCANTSLIFCVHHHQRKRYIFDSSRIQERGRKTKLRTDYSHRHHGWTQTKNGGILLQTRESDRDRNPEVHHHNNEDTHRAGFRIELAETELADTWTHELDERWVGEAVDGSH